jgi:hypothetical protein
MPAFLQGKPEIIARQKRLKIDKILQKSNKTTEFDMLMKRERLTGARSVVYNKQNKNRRDFP